MESQSVTEIRNGVKVYRYKNTGRAVRLPMPKSHVQELETTNQESDKLLSRKKAEKFGTLARISTAIGSESTMSIKSPQFQTLQTYLSRKAEERLIEDDYQQILHKRAIAPKPALNRNMTVEEMRIVRENPRKFLENRKKFIKGSMFTTHLLSKNQYRHLLQVSNLTERDLPLSKQVLESFKPVEQKLEQFHQTFVKRHPENPENSSITTRAIEMSSNILDTHQSMSSPSMLFSTTDQPYPQRRTISTLKSLEERRFCTVTVSNNGSIEISQTQRAKTPIKFVGSLLKKAAFNRILKKEDSETLHATQDTTMSKRIFDGGEESQSQNNFTERSSPDKIVDGGYITSPRIQSSYENYRATRHKNAEDSTTLRTNSLIKVFEKENTVASATDSLLIGLENLKIACNNELDGSKQLSSSFLKPKPVNKLKIDLTDFQEEHLHKLIQKKVIEEKQGSQTPREMMKAKMKFYRRSVLKK